MGAEGLHDLLQIEDLDAKSYELRHKLIMKLLNKGKMKLLKDLQVIEAFRDANIRIETSLNG